MSVTPSSVDTSSLCCEEGSEWGNGVEELEEEQVPPASGSGAAGGEWAGVVVSKDGYIDTEQTMVHG